jgi:hypothetical protein
MKKYSLSIDHENHRNIFCPIVGYILNKKLSENKNIEQPAKKRKICWNTIMQEEDFLQEIQA